MHGRKGRFFGVVEMGIAGDGENSTGNRGREKVEGGCVGGFDGGYEVWWMLLREVEDGCDFVSDCEGGETVAGGF